MTGRYSRTRSTCWEINAHPVWVGTEVGARDLPVDDTSRWMYHGNSFLLTVRDSVWGIGSLTRVAEILF